jgi:hypothetical protein
VKTCYATITNPLKNGIEITGAEGKRIPNKGFQKVNIFG